MITKKMFQHFNDINDPEIQAYVTCHYRELIHFSFKTYEKNTVNIIEKRTTICAPYIIWFNIFFKKLMSDKTLFIIFFNFCDCWSIWSPYIFYCFVL
jgi:hypothetical protein